MICAQTWNEHYFDITDGYYVGNVLPVKRLNIPSINMQDAAQGWRTTSPKMYTQVTSWPCGLGVAGDSSCSGSSSSGFYVAVVLVAVVLSVVLVVVLAVPQ